MRAKEFISEDKQKLDEIAPLAVAGWALTAGTAAWQAYDTYNDIQTYNKSEKTEADLDKLKAAIGMDTLALVAGGAAGKLVGKTISLGATPFKAVKKIYDAKKQAAAAKKAAEKSAAAAKKVEPMKSVKTPGASIGSTTTKVAQQPKTVVQKVKDFAKGPGDEAAGAAAAKLATKKKPKVNVSKSAGATAGKTTSKLKPPLKATTAAGALTGKAALDQFNKLQKGFDDWEKNRNAANTAGANSYVYTGDKKDPPKSDFVAKNLDLERLKVKK
jgi:hypothetical protein